MLTKIEHAVLEAFSNESETLTREERAEFKHQLNAYRNAAIYADMFGFDVKEFKQTITRLSGVSDADIKEN